MFVVGGADRTRHVDPFETGRRCDHLPDVTQPATPRHSADSHSKYG